MVHTVILMAKFFSMCVLNTLFNMVVISSVMSWRVMVWMGELMVGASAEVPRKQISQYPTKCQQGHQPLLKHLLVISNFITQNIKTRIYIFMWVMCLVMATS